MYERKATKTHTTTKEKNLQKNDSWIGCRPLLPIYKPPMLKIFQAAHHGHDGDDSHGDHGHGHGHGSIEVKIENDDIIEEELGQVALDILDCSEKIIIIAPIA